MERFLRYSLRWNCPIRLMWMEDGRMKSGNVTVVNLGGDGFEFVSARSRGKRRALCFDAVLAASYARGDDGDTTNRASAPPEGEVD